MKVQFEDGGFYHEKTSILVSLVLVIVLILSGCGNKNAGNSSADNSKKTKLKTLDSEAALFSNQLDAIVESNTGAAKLVVKKQGKVLLDCRDNHDWKGMNLIVSRTEFAK